MPKHIQVQVAEPCHENWENMSLSDKGRFCDSCQKQVVDFTTMTDSQIAVFFKKPSTGSVCGRFFQDQVDRDLEIPRKRLPWIKYFFQVVIPAFLVSRSAAQDSKAAVKEEVKSVCDRVVYVQGGARIPVELYKAQTRPIEIKGQVLDNLGLPLAGTTVIIKGTNLGYSTDKDGYFHISNINRNDDLVLVVSSVGFIVQERKIDLKNDSIPTKFELISLEKQQEEILMGMVITVRKVRRKTIPLIEEVLPDSSFNIAKAFPNPVIAGEPLTIQNIKLAKGKYIMELLNGAGQMVHRKEVSIENEKQMIGFNTPLVRPGTYYLKITNKVTRMSVTDKVVIQ